MAFDLSTAVDVVEDKDGAIPGGFDLSTARDVPSENNKTTPFDDFVKGSFGTFAESFKESIKPFATGAVKQLEKVGLIDDRAPKIDIENKQFIEFLNKPFATEKEMEKHPIAKTIGMVGGGIAPFIATAPIFPQTLIGTIGTFATVGGVSEVGEQEITGKDDSSEIVKEIAKGAVLGPVWHYSNKLTFIGKPVIGALSRAGVRGAGTASVAAVFGDNLSESLKQGGHIMALSLVFESPYLAKTALGRQLVKEGRLRVEADMRSKGVSEGEIRANVTNPLKAMEKSGQIDAVSAKKSIFDLIKKLHDVIKKPLSKAEQKASENPEAYKAIGSNEVAINKMSEVAKFTDTVNKEIARDASGKPIEVNATPEETIGELSVAEPDLTTEALKHDTVEGFVKSSGEVIFRGGEPVNIEKGKTKGISFSLDKEVAEKFSKFVKKEKGSAVVEEFILSKDTKILKFENLPDNLKNVSDATDEVNIQKIVEYAKENNFDVVDLTPLGEDEFRVINSDKLKTTQQLTDIYEKAHAKKTKPKPKKKQTRKQKYDEMVTRLAEIKKTKQELEAQKETTKEVRGYFKSEKEQYKHRIRRYKDGKLDEEYNELPNYYRTKEGGIILDEAASEAGFTSDQEFLNHLIDIDNQIKNTTQDIADINESIREETQKKVVRSEVSVLKQRLSDFKAGKLEKVKELKELRKDLKQQIRKELPPSERGKLINAIDSIKDEVTLQRAEAKLDDIVKNYEDKFKKDKASASIETQLKFTKPTKKNVGKFDYESNKVFDELRAINKMTKSTAMEALSIAPSENLTEMDLIKQRLLSLKANGKDATVELHEQVLADVKFLKQQGKLAKSEEDMLKRVERQEKIEEVLTKIKELKPDKSLTKKGKVRLSDKAKTTIGNNYIEGLGHIGSVLNYVAGKDIAIKYDGELPELKRNVGKESSVKKVNQKIMDIYNIKHRKGISDLFSKVDLIEKFTNEMTEEFSMTDIRGLNHERLNKFFIMDVYNSIKNDLLRERYFNAFGAEQVNSLISNLTDAEKLQADAYMEGVQEYTEIYNNHNIKTKGRDSGKSKNYWPSSSEFEIDVLDDYIMQSENPSALNPRSKSSKIFPVIRDARMKFEKHVHVGEHLKHVSDRYAELKRIFTNSFVEKEIVNRYGQEIYDLLMEKIKDLSLNRQMKRLNLFDRIANKARGNWVKAKIGFPNITAPLRQLNSPMLYMENMKPAEWTKYYVEGLKTPKETFKFMWDNIPYLEFRFKMGFNEAVEEAIKGASDMKSKMEVWSTALTMPTRGADIMAIVYGGYPLYKSEIDKGTPPEEAMDIFLKATVGTQQSGLRTSRSELQKEEGAFTKTYMSFMNTVSQLTRKGGDAIISYIHKDIDATQLAKTLFIFNFIQPLLYTLTGIAVKEGLFGIGRLITGRIREEQTDADLKDITKNALIELAISPTAAIPFMEDALSYAIRKQTGKDAYGAISHPMFDDLEKGWKKIFKKNVSYTDLLEASSILIEPTVGFGAGNSLRYKSYLLDAKERK